MSHSIDSWFHWNLLCHPVGPVGHLRYAIAKNHGKNHPVITYYIIQVYLLPSLSLYPCLHHKQSHHVQGHLQANNFEATKQVVPTTNLTRVFPVMLHRHTCMIAKLLSLFLVVLVSFIFYHHMYGNTAKISFPHACLPTYSPIMWSSWTKQDYKLPKPFKMITNRPSSCNTILC